MCGKTILVTDTLIVRSFGTTSWTDRNTGENRTKYGSLYIHFQKKCLKNFDTERFYGPKKFIVNKDTPGS